MEDYEAEEKKQAAVRVLSNYSQFVMVCIGEGVTPHQLRLHLMKEISGMPTSLDAYKYPAVSTAEVASSSEAGGRMDVNQEERPTSLHKNKLLSAK